MPGRVEEINRLQNQIIIHSIIYYNYDDNIWSDEQFDKTCMKLVSLMETKEFKLSEHYESFKDFDGSTGCHLATIYKASKDHVAFRILRYHKKLNP